MGPTASRDAWPVQALAMLSVLGLYLRVLPIGSYSVTLGGLAAAAVVLVSMRQVAVRLLPLGVGLLLLLWPVLVFQGAALIGAETLPPSDEFLRSYALWAGSVVLITLAFVSCRPLHLPAPFALASLILAVALAQLLIAGLAGSLAGFAAVAPLLGIDLEHGYLRMVPGWDVRAIGLYYEPSMCGRVLGTLAFIDFLRNRRLLRAAGVMLLAILLTRSLGLIVLVAAIGAILLGRSLRELLGLALLGALVFAAQGSSIAQRLESAGAQADSSGYRRTVAPLATVAGALSANPAGIPIGANEHVAQASGYARETGESKITNGVYEALLYLGIPGMLLLGAALAGVGLLVVAGHRERAAALLYLLLSTALSGSFLAIESSLLTYYFVVACLAARPRFLASRHRSRFAGPAAAPRRPAWGIAPAGRR